MKSIIIDKRLPAEAKEKLKSYGTLLELESNGIVYDAISGHPDIFMCQTVCGLVIAPNIPQPFIDKLDSLNITYHFGYKNLGAKYPETAFYNAVVTNKYLIHNLKYTDKSILETCSDKIIIHVAQAYTRCNLIAIDESSFITSDKSIEKSIQKHSLNVLYVNPEEIVLPEYPFGFFGGCCGTIAGKLIITGSMKYFKERKSVMRFIKNINLDLVELYDGKLFDGGGIIFINS